jgi:hypothetical protein
VNYLKMKMEKSYLKVSQYFHGRFGLDIRGNPGLEYRLLIAKIAFFLNMEQT